LRDAAIESDVFTQAQAVGGEAYNAALAANITGIKAMRGEDLLDLPLLGFLDDTPIDSEILGLSYSEWTVRAESKRVELLERADSGDAKVWDELEDLTNDGFGFIESPEEARLDAEASFLRMAEIFIVPAEIVETLLDCLGDFEAQKEYDESPELQELLTQAKNSPSVPGRGFRISRKRGGR
jgi:hypothetical protein